LFLGGVSPLFYPDPIPVPNLHHPASWRTGNRGKSHVPNSDGISNGQSSGINPVNHYACYLRIFNRRHWLQLSEVIHDGEYRTNVRPESIGNVVSENQIPMITPHVLKRDGHKTRNRRYG